MDPRFNQGAAPDAFNPYLYGKHFIFTVNLSAMRDSSKKVFVLCCVFLISRITSLDCAKNAFYFVKSMLTSRKHDRLVNFVVVNSRNLFVCRFFTFFTRSRCPMIEHKFSIAVKFRFFSPSNTLFLFSRSIRSPPSRQKKVDILFSSYHI